MLYKVLRDTLTPSVRQMLIVVVILFQEIRACFYHYSAGLSVLVQLGPDLIRIPFELETSKYLMSLH